MRAFILIHAVNREPVFQGAFIERAMLVPVSEIKLIEELPDGRAMIYLADGSIFEAIESFQALETLLASGS